MLMISKISSALKLSATLIRLPVHCIYPTELYEVYIHAYVLLWNCQLLNSTFNYVAHLFNNKGIKLDFMAENVMKPECFFFFGCQSHIVQRLTAFEKNADMTLTTKKRAVVCTSIQRSTACIQTEPEPTFFYCGFWCRKATVIIHSALVHSKNIIPTAALCISIIINLTIIIIIICEKWWIMPISPM